MDNLSAHSIATVVPGSSTGTVVPGSSTGTSGLLSPETIRATLEKGLAGKFTGQKILVLIPDHTRSLPLPFLFRALIEILGDTWPRAPSPVREPGLPRENQDYHAGTGTTTLEPGLPRNSISWSPSARIRR